MFALSTFFAISLIGVIWGFGNDKRVFQLPCILGLANIFYICPQAWVLHKNRSPTFQEHLGEFMLFSSVCVFAAYVGFFSRKISPNEQKHYFSRLRLEHAGIVLAILGLTGSLGLQLLTFINPEAVTARRWSGLPVYIYTLSKFVCPALTLLILATYPRGTASRRAKFLLLFCILAICNYAILAGRRQWAFLLVYSAFMPLVLQERIRIGRLAMIFAVGVAPMIFVLFPAYREHVMDNGAIGIVEAVSETPPSEVFEKYLSGKQTLELEGAVMLATAAKTGNSYSWGGEILNGFINKYVPAGILGRDFKDALYFATPTRKDELTSVFGHKYFVPDYTGKPSYHDAYTNFGWLGFMLYFFLGRIFAYYTHLAFLYQDCRGILFLALLGFIPAGLVYGAWGFIIPIFLPVIVFFFLLKRYTVYNPQILDSLFGHPQDAHTHSQLW